MQTLFVIPFKSFTKCRIFAILVTETMFIFGSLFNKYFWFQLCSTIYCHLNKCFWWIRIKNSANHYNYALEPWNQFIKLSQRFGQKSPNRVLSKTISQPEVESLVMILNNAYLVLYLKIAKSYMRSLTCLIIVFQSEIFFYPLIITIKGQKICINCFKEPKIDSI